MSKHVRKSFHTSTRKRVENSYATRGVAHRITTLIDIATGDASTFVEDGPWYRCRPRAKRQRPLPALISG